MRTFRLWAVGDPHVGTDLRRGGRRSLAEAIQQAERGGAEGGPPFAWDLMLDIGDLSGSQEPPDDAEGEEVIRQYAVSTRHPRERGCGGRPLAPGAEVGRDVPERRGAVEAPRAAQCPDEPPADVHGRQQGGAHPVLPPHERLRAARLVCARGADGAAATPF